MLKRLIICVAGVATLATIWLLARGTSNPTTLDTGGLFFRELEVDFGRVAQGRVAKRDVHLVNGSAFPAKVMAIVPSCSCIRVGAVPSLTVEPGATLAVPLVYASGSEEGVRRQRVQVECSIGEGIFNVACDLVAYVEPAVRVSDRYVRFGRITSDDIVVKSVRFSSTNGSQVKVAKIYVNNARLSAKAISSDELALEVDPRGCISEELIQGEVFVEVTEPLPLTLAIRATALVVPRVQCEPRCVVLKPNSDGRAVAEVALTSACSATLAECDPPEFLALESVSAQSTGDATIIKLMVSSAYDAGPICDVLVVSLESAGSVSEHRIPVVVLAAGSGS